MKNKSKKAIGLILVAVLIDFMGVGAVVPVLAHIFQDPSGGILPASVTETSRDVLYGLFFAIQSFCQFIGAPVLGAYADRLGRKKVIIFAISANTLSYILFAFGIFTKSLLLIYLSRVLAGLFGSSLPVMQSAISDVSAPEAKARNFGIIGIGFGFGIIIGAVMGGILSSSEVVSWFNYTTPFIFIAILSVANLLFISYVFEETLIEKNEDRINFFQGFHNVYKAFTVKELKVMFTVVLIMTFGFAFFFQFLPLFLEKKYSFSTLQVGLFSAFFGLCVAFSQGVVLRLVSYIFTPAKVLIFSIPLFAASYFLLIIPENPIWFYILTPVLVTFQGVTYPNTLSIISNSAKKNMQGSIIGINQSVHALAMTLPPLLASGFLAFNIHLPMYLGAGCAFLAWIIYLLFYKR